MWTWVLDLLKLLWNGRREASDTIADGFGNLLTAHERWQAEVERRLTDCEKDREALHKEQGVMQEELRKANRTIVQLRDEIEVLRQRQQ